MKNPQAFPCPASKCENARGDSYNGTEGQDGMTLRDYFAGQALIGLAERGFVEKNIAVIAYQTADAMLAQREKKND